MSSAMEEATPKEPSIRQSKRDMTTREKIILLQGSKLNGHVFTPWKCSPNASEFDCPIDQSQFT